MRREAREALVTSSTSSSSSWGSANSTTKGKDPTDAAAAAAAASSGRVSTLLDDRRRLWSVSSQQAKGEEEEGQQHGQDRVLALSSTSRIESGWRGRVTRTLSRYAFRGDDADADDLDDDDGLFGRGGKDWGDVLGIQLIMGGISTSRWCAFLDVEVSAADEDNDPVLLFFSLMADMCSF
jgi:hypothetical protein